MKHDKRDNHDNYDRERKRQLDREIKAQRRERWRDEQGLPTVRQQFGGERTKNLDGIANLRNALQVEGEPLGAARGMVEAFEHSQQQYQEQSGMDDPQRKYEDKPEPANDAAWVPDFLATLSQRQQDVYECTFVARLSERDGAHVLKVSRSTYKTYLTQLKAAVEQEARRRGMEGER